MPVKTNPERLPVSESPISSFRKTHGLSRAELANQIGVSSATIFRWETGKTKPSQLALERVQNLGLSILHSSEGAAGNISRIKRSGNTSRAKGIAAENLANESSRPISLPGGAVTSTPTAWVRNGPPDQSGFHNALIEMQVEGGRRLNRDALARRFSLIQNFDGIGTTAQFDLERPRPVSMAWNSNYGSHGWHRYVGRFPPHVIRSLLNAFGADHDSVVCDPFLGSGTTAVECRLLGIPFVGAEICPLSCLISRTKATFPTEQGDFSDLAPEFVDFFNKKHSQFTKNHRIDSVTHADVISRSGNPVPAFVNVEKWFTPAALFGVSIAVEFALRQTGFRRDAMLLAISAKMRSIGNVDVDVVRAEYSKKPREDVDVCSLVSGHLSKMLRDMARMNATHAGLIGAANSIEIRETSVLDMKLPKGSISHIITSPPYGVEAISYLRTHLLSYRSLISELKHDPYETRDKTIGSEYTPRDESVSFERASSTSKSFRTFFSTPSPDTKLVHRTQAMMQFFEDLYCVGLKFSEWLKPGGNVAFVLGNKRLGENIIPADQIVIEMFKALGLKHVRSIKHKLKTNNSNSVVPWQDRIIDEEAILFFKFLG